MGRVRTERSSERKRAANQANARRPRGRWAGTSERAALEEAKRLLRGAIADGAERLAADQRQLFFPGGSSKSSYQNDSQQPHREVAADQDAR
jgi:hypothetical protein